MSFANCCDCGGIFEQDAQWKIRCVSCWRENKDREAKRGRTSQPRHQQAQHTYQQQRPQQSYQQPRPQQAPQPQPQQSNTSHYQKEITRLRQEVEALRMQLLLEKNRTRPTQHAASSAIPEDMLGRLIRLAHPDRHNNSEASNKATAWLLLQRKGTSR